jgi:hypothetical protein
MEETMNKDHKHTAAIGKKLEKCINDHIMENPRGLHPNHIGAALAAIAGEFHSHLSERDREAFVKTFWTIAQTPSPNVKIVKMQTTTPQ